MLIFTISTQSLVELFKCGIHDLKSYKKRDKEITY